MPRLVIVGASLAGLRAAQGARRAGWDGEIAVVGEERHMPYTRPPLSKQLLTTPGQGVQDHLFPAQLEATWILGERAGALDCALRRITLVGGEQIAYDRLVIATGCAPRQWPGPGAELAGVHTLRHADDALALRKALVERPRLAIVGAGFIGCEVAASARELGLEVTLLDLATTPMPGLGKLVGERCAALHRSHGVNLILGAAIGALYGDGGRVAGVELVDGSRIEAGLVLIALGALPQTAWLAGSGLALEPGVRCDVTLTAEGAPDVLAAGDVAAWPQPLADGGLIRVEHWTNAAEQGGLAGRNAVLSADRRVAHTGLPSFWSDQYDVKIQAIGLPRLAERWHVVESSEDEGRLVTVAERRGLLVAAVALDGARRLPWYRRLIGGPLDLKTMRAALAADPNALRPAPADAAPDLNTASPQPERTP